MRVGITGHQNRPGIDWKWVAQTIESELRSFSAPIEGLTSLAEGADQVFADAVLRCGGSLRAIIPLPDYEHYFRGAAAAAFHRLKAASKLENLKPAGSDQASFYNAGKYIADAADILMAVWDGKSSKGFGGTADVVRYALRGGKSVIHINPIKKSVQRKRPLGPTFISEF